MRDSVTSKKRGGIKEDGFEAGAGCGVPHPLSRHLMWTPTARRPGQSRCAHRPCAPPTRADKRRSQRPTPAPFCRLTRTQQPIEEDDHAQHRVRMPLQHTQTNAACRIPYPHRLVGRRRRQPPAVKGSHAAHAARVPFQHEQTSAASRVPNPHRPVARRSRNPPIAHSLTPLPRQNQKRTREAGFIEALLKAKLKRI